MDAKEIAKQSRLIVEQHSDLITNDMMEQIDTAWVKKNKLPFARAGVFNPYTLSDWNAVGIKMAHGIPPHMDREFWFLDRWFNTPVRLVRTRGKLQRDGRTKWRYTVTSSQLCLTPHALSRFRERSGCLINTDVQCWNIPHITDGVDLTPRGNVITSQMLPTLGGAWLGYTSVLAGKGVEQYSYSPAKGLICKKPGEGKQVHQFFYALTYITEQQMTWDQIDACRAYEAGDYGKFDQLNKTLWLAHPTSIFE